MDDPVVMAGGAVSAGGEVGAFAPEGDGSGGDEEPGFMETVDLEEEAPDDGAAEAGAAEEGAAEAGAAVVALSSGNSIKESHSSSVLQSGAASISASETSFPVTPKQKNQ